jgi:hypothetical protein
MSLRISASWRLSSRKAHRRLSNTGGAAESHGVAPVHGHVPESRSHKRLSNPDRPHDHDVVADIPEHVRSVAHGGEKKPVNRSPFPGHNDYRSLGAIAR